MNIPFEPLCWYYTREEIHERNKTRKSRARDQASRARHCYRAYNIFASFRLRYWSYQQLGKGSNCSFFWNWRCTI